MKHQRPEPEDVPGEQEPASRAVPKGERKFARDSVQRVLAPGKKAFEQQGGVGKLCRPGFRHADCAFEFLAIVDTDIRDECIWTPNHRAAIGCVLRKQREQVPTQRQRTKVG